MQTPRGCSKSKRGARPRTVVGGGVQERHLAEMIPRVQRALAGLAAHGQAPAGHNVEEVARVTLQRGQPSAPGLWAHE